MRGFETKSIGFETRRMVLEWLSVNRSRIQDRFSLMNGKLEEGSKGAHIKNCFVPDILYQGKQVM